MNSVLTFCLHLPVQSTYSHTHNLLISDHTVIHIEIYGGNGFIALWTLPFQQWRHFVDWIALNEIFALCSFWWLFILCFMESKVHIPGLWSCWLAKSGPKLSAVFGNSHWKWPTARSKELVIVQGAVCSVIFPNSSAAGKFGCLASSNGCLNSFVAWEIVWNKGANVDWHKPVGFSPSVARYGFISWSVIHDKLPTFERINSWSVGSIRSLCLFCKSKHWILLSSIFFLTDYRARYCSFVLSN